RNLRIATVNLFIVWRGRGSDYLPFLFKSPNAPASIVPSSLRSNDSSFGSPGLVRKILFPEIAQSTVSLSMSGPCMYAFAPRISSVTPPKPVADPHRPSSFEPHGAPRVLGGGGGAGAAGL